MTDTTDTALSGEVRLKSRRNRFWRFCFVGFAVAAAAGFVTGVAQGWVSDGVVPAWAMVGLWAASLAGFAWFALSYFRRVDELVRLDNLWATLVGFYFYCVALPSWYLFHDAGLLAAPNQYVIYVATMLVMCAAYGLRKLGWR